VCKRISSLHQFSHQSTKSLKGAFSSTGKLGKLAISSAGKLAFSSSVAPRNLLRRT